MARQSYESIRKQITRLEAQAKALEAAREESKARSVEKVQALMKKLGVDLADLQSAAPAKGRRAARPAAGRTAAAVGAKGARGAKKAGASRGPVPAKFRDPASGATWSGRGRTPVWLAAYLAQGQTKEAFAIDAAAPQA